MLKSTIEWCDTTWNPVTGCRHGCKYCYARRIAERFGSMKFPTDELHVLNEQMVHITKEGRIAASPYPFGFEPTLHRYRLEEMKRKKRPRTIFVCSMADLFGEWVPTRWIVEVLDTCLAAPQHRYLLLTKNPGRYLELDKLALLPHGENFWYGSTVPDETAQAMYPKAEDINTFWSMEPLLGPVDITESEGLPQWIILGAMTGPGSAKRQPKREWVEDIVRAADASEIPVFMKDSLLPIVGEAGMRRELPWEKTYEYQKKEGL